MFKGSGANLFFSMFGLSVNRLIWISVGFIAGFFAADTFVSNPTPLIEYCIWGAVFSFAGYFLGIYADKLDSINPKPDYVNNSPDSGNTGPGGFGE